MQATRCSPLLSHLSTGHRFAYLESSSISGYRQAKLPRSGNRQAVMAAIKRAFQGLGILSSQGDKEEETDVKEQDLDSTHADDGKDRLKVKWFSEIPRCSVRSLLLDYG